MASNRTFGRLIHLLLETVDTISILDHSVNRSWIYWVRSSAHWPTAKVTRCCLRISEWYREMASVLSHWQKFWTTWRSTTGARTTWPLAVEGHCFRSWTGTPRSVLSSAAVLLSMGKKYVAVFLQPWESQDCLVHGNWQNASLCSCFCFCILFLAPHVRNFSMEQLPRQGWLLELWSHYLCPMDPH